MSTERDAEFHARQRALGACRCAECRGEEQRAKWAEEEAARMAPVIQPGELTSPQPMGQALAEVAEREGIIHFERVESPSISTEGAVRSFGVLDAPANPLFSGPTPSPGIYGVHGSTILMEHNEVLDRAVEAKEEARKAGQQLLDVFFESFKDVTGVDLYAPAKPLDPARPANKLPWRTDRPVSSIAEAMLNGDGFVRVKPDSDGSPELLSPGAPLLPPLPLGYEDAIVARFERGELSRVDEDAFRVAVQNAATMEHRLFRSTLRLLADDFERLVGVLAFTRDVSQEQFEWMQKTLRMLHERLGR
jgi:hypothetical protein